MSELFALALSSTSNSELNIVFCTRSLCLPSNAALVT